MKIHPQIEAKNIALIVQVIDFNGAAAKGLIELVDEIGETKALAGIQARDPAFSRKYLKLLLRIGMKHGKPDDLDVVSEALEFLRRKNTPGNCSESLGGQSPPGQFNLNP